MKNSLPTVLALLSGLLVLLGLLFVPALAYSLLGWVSFLAACALLLGLGNLFVVHLRRTLQANPYSLVLILSMIVVFLVGLGDMLGVTDGDLSQQFFENLQKPLETAFSSLLVFFLLFAGFRLFRRRRDGWSVLFLVTVILFCCRSPSRPRTCLPPCVTSSTIFW